MSSAKTGGIVGSIVHRDILPWRAMRICHVEGWSCDRFTEGLTPQIDDIAFETLAQIGFDNHQSRV